MPAPYVDAWIAFTAEMPAGVKYYERWWRARRDGEAFFRRWGWMCEGGHEWAKHRLFDAPKDGGAGGLFWQLRGREVIAIGYDSFELSDDSVLDFDATFAANAARRSDRKS